MSSTDCSYADLSGDDLLALAEAQVAHSLAIIATNSPRTRQSVAAHPTVLELDCDDDDDQEMVINHAIEPNAAAPQPEPAALQPPAVVELNDATDDDDNTGGNDPEILINDNHSSTSINITVPDTATMAAGVVVHLLNDDDEANNSDVMFVDEHVHSTPARHRLAAHSRNESATDVIFVSAEPQTTGRRRQRNNSEVIVVGDVTPAKPTPVAVAAVSADATATPTMTTSSTMRPLPSPEPAACSAAQAAQKEIKCAVCLESPFAAKPTTTACGHLFCAACIAMAVRVHRKCPLCNRKLTPAQVKPLYV